MADQADERLSHWRDQTQAWLDAVSAHALRTSGRRSFGARVSAFVLVAAALVAAALVVIALVPGWSRLDRPVQIGVAFVLVVGGLWLGARLARRDSSWSTWGAQCAWLGATAAFGAFVYATFVETLGSSSTSALAALGVLALSVALWRNEDRPLQFLAFVVALAWTVVAVCAHAQLTVTPFEREMFAWYAAVALGVLALERVRPAMTALVVAVLGALVAAVAVTFTSHLMGVALGLASAGLAIVIGVARHRPLVVVLGVLGYFVVVIRVFAIYLQSVDAAGGAFVAGVALIVVALWRATRSSSVETRDASDDEVSSAPR